MPEKSVREMNAAERAHYSLAAKTFHTTLIGTIILGLVTLLIIQGLYVYALTSRYIGEAFGLSRSAATIVKAAEIDTDRLVNEVMDLYRSLSPEERAEAWTPAYHRLFLHVKVDDDYQLLNSVLREFRIASDVDDLYFAVYDRETSSLVYVCDPDERAGYICEPGDWEELETRELEKFLTWDGTGQLYDISKTDRYGWLCTAGVPMNDASAPVRCFILADVSLGNVAHGIRSLSLQFLLAMLVILFFYAYLMTRRMKKALVAPINAIAKAAENYAKDKSAGVAVTEHFALLNIRSGDELENLSLVLADMEHNLSEYEENLTRAVAEKERIGTELSLATRIQADMLPNIFPAFPDRTDLNIYASMTPAKEVGGDFYDFFLLDDNHLGLVIADVSGKGVPAALFMMVSKILLQNYLMGSRSPREALRTINEQICQNNREEMFVTVWLGILDLTNGRLTAANAGHEYPVLKMPDGAFEIIHDRHGFVIGGMAGMQYKEYTLQLEPGSKLFLYTDGVPEATNEQNELFGMDRLLQTLNRAEDGTPDEILARVHEAVNLFVGTAPQFDDLTMLCVEYLGQTTGRTRPMKELTLEATNENIAVVTDFINAELETLDCPMKAQMQIDIAVDELFTNIASYAYKPGTGEATVRFEVEEEPRTAVIRFIDSGVPFNPLLSKEPDVTLSAEEREAGGLGVFLVKKTMDDMRYERRDGKNIVTIKKRI